MINIKSIIKWDIRIRYFIYITILTSLYMGFNLQTSYIPTQKGVKWTEIEQNELLQELQNNLTVEEIAYRHKRTIGAINMRRNQIAAKMYSNNTTIDIIKNITKLKDYQINYIIKIKENKILDTMMKNGTWNKPKVENKNEHIQNMKDELFMMKYGYWVKIKDDFDDLNKQFAYKEWELSNPFNNVPFEYKSKSKYPDIILQKKDNPPVVDNVLYIGYVHIDYILDTNIDPSYGDYSNIDNILNEAKEYNNNKKYNLIKKQFDMKIKSFESMIYLFENM